MEEKKKSNTLISITIVVLVILVIGLVGFITYDKVLNKDNNCVEEKEEIKEWKTLLLISAVNKAICFVFLFLTTLLENN